MNEQLKFSWGHIIAFLALIAISYISFVGVTYFTNGNFLKASVAMIIIDIVLFVFFIGAQIAKATIRKFAKRIWIERIFIFSSPIVFVLCIMPFYHFGVVHSHNDEIVKGFSNSISLSKQLFDNYDKYADQRIANYEHMLNRVISNRQLYPSEFTSCGFTYGQEQIQKDNMVKTLRLQLLSHNYDSLKTEAIKWIDSSSKGASTWNVFLLGNTKQILSAMNDWNAQLAEFANHKMNNEEFNGYNKVEVISSSSSSLTAVKEGFGGLTNRFTDAAFPPIWSILVSIILYFALLFPYILQDRNTKSQFRLIGMEKGASLKPSSVIIEKHIEEVDDSNDDSLSSIETGKNDKGLSDDDDYASFTM